MKDWAALSSEKGHLSPKDTQHGEAEEVPSLGWSDFTLEVFTEPSISTQRTPFLCPQKPDSRSPDSRTPSARPLVPGVVPTVRASSNGELTPAVPARKCPAAAPAPVDAAWGSWSGGEQTWPVPLPVLHRG